MPIADSYSADVFSDLIKATPRTALRREFQFSWRLLQDNHVAASGVAADGIIGVVEYGEGLGGPPFTALGLVVGKAFLDSGRLYEFSFAPTVEFAALLKATPVVQIEYQGRS